MASTKNIPHYHYINHLNRREQEMRTRMQHKNIRYNFFSLFLCCERAVQYWWLKWECIAPEENIAKIWAKTRHTHPSPHESASGIFLSRICRYTTTREPPFPTFPLPENKTSHIPTSIPLPFESNSHFLIWLPTAPAPNAKTIYMCDIYN